MYFSRWYSAKQVSEFKITDTKLYFPVVPLSTQDNVKLLKQLEPVFSLFFFLTFFFLSPYIQEIQYN